MERGWCGACPLMCDLPPAHTQRLVHIQSMLKRAPSYRTLELELLEWQERELFEYFVVVSLRKKPSRNTYLPEVSYQFPKVRPSPSPAPPHHFCPPGPSGGEERPWSCQGASAGHLGMAPVTRREDRASGGAGVRAEGEGGENTSQCAWNKVRLS